MAEANEPVQPEGALDSPHLNLRPAEMTVVVQEEDRRYLVTDEGLDELSSKGKDKSFEWSLFLGGCAIGLFQNFFSLLGSISESQLPVWDVVASLIFAAMAAGAVAKYTQHKTNEMSIDRKVEKIKNGKEVVTK